LKKDEQQRGVDSTMLYAYIALARQRDDTVGGWPVFDTSESIVKFQPANLVISTVDTLDRCNLVSSSPSAFDTKAIKKISIISQRDNVLITQSCCTAGTYKDSTEDEVETEGLIYKYSKQACKNSN
jgi:hypothetical protein